MSLAYEELKLLLLENDWCNGNENLLDALQMMLSIAEMKTNNNRYNMLINCENHVACASTESIISELNLSMNAITFGDSEEESKETETFFTPDENYDVRD
jgi:hypothetical protein